VVADHVDFKICVVIPCYRVTLQIAKVIEAIPPLVSKIIVVDDCCPDHSGEFVKQHCVDARVEVIRNPINQGVGGAVLAGYRVAAKSGADVVLKIDGDGQMDPALIPAFIEPITSGRADYTKGNRFFDLEQISQMPALRIMGNSGLSFFSKISTGYWRVFDPTNGYTAIRASIIHNIPHHKISSRYFFESDMLFRLNCLQAVVEDVPMHAKYGDEQSNLVISRVFSEFLIKHIKNTMKRLVYNYFLRDFSVASLELVAGLVLLAFGICFGLRSWSVSMHGSFASSGTVMLAALPVLLGIQFLLAFMSYDISNQPKLPIGKKLEFLNLNLKSKDGNK
jgi:glycosyltransferase involved in cell wall biosynthesis